MRGGFPVWAHALATLVGILGAFISAYNLWFGVGTPFWTNVGAGAVSGLLVVHWPLCLHLWAGGGEVISA